MRPRNALRRFSVVLASILLSPVIVDAIDWTVAFTLGIKNEAQWADSQNPNGFGYAYAPAIVKEGSTYYMFSCAKPNAGDGAYDVIRLATSLDGVTWSPDPMGATVGTDTKLKSTGGFYSGTFSKERGTCDPSIVKHGSYWYMFYASMDGDRFNAAGVIIDPGDACIYAGSVSRCQTAIYVARTQSLASNDWYKKTRSGHWVRQDQVTDDDPALPIVVRLRAYTLPFACSFDAINFGYSYGAGMPSVVVKQDAQGVEQFHLWYYDDSGCDDPNPTCHVGDVYGKGCAVGNGGVTYYRTGTFHSYTCPSSGLSCDYIEWTPHALNTGVDAPIGGYRLPPQADVKFNANIANPRWEMYVVAPPPGSPSGWESNSTLYRRTAPWNTPTTWGPLETFRHADSVHDYAGAVGVLGNSIGWILPGDFVAAYGAPYLPGCGKCEDPFLSRIAGWKGNWNGSYGPPVLP